jgi:hypothetical protein
MGVNGAAIGQLLGLHRTEYVFRCQYFDRAEIERLDLVLD